MKLFGGMAFQVWFLPSLVLAQVEIKLEVPQPQFLPGEKIETVVRFSNFTGQVLTLGGDNGWLRFHVENRGGMVINKINEVEETGSFQLQPVERGTLRFNLTPHFKLDQTGKYRVSVVARLPSGEEITSPAASFELVRGTRLTEQLFGYHGPEGSERRKFILQQVNYLKEVRLYVRCCDERESTTYQVFLIGKTVSFTKPQQSLDAESRWHVLHQFGRTEYAYHVFGPDGDLQTRQTFSIADHRPKLLVNDAGKITVIGGVRRPSPDDFPAPRAAKLTEPAPFTPNDTSKDLPKKL